MCAYNRVNGEPACASQFLLQNQLRGKWGFTGYVVSDCDAVLNISRDHHFVKTRPEASALAVQRGMDNECNTYQKMKDDSDYHAYIDAVRQGFLKESDMDRSLVRLFTARIRLGMFDPSEMVPFTKIDEKLLDSAEHRSLARRIANQSMVLLKNDGVLPIAAKGKKILVVGPLAEQTEVLLGNYNGHPNHTVSIMEGMYAEFGKENITFMPGTTFLEQATEPVTAEAFRSEQNGLRVTYKYTVESEDKTRKDVTVDGGMAETVSFDKLPQLKKQPQGKLVSVMWNGRLNVTETGYYNLGVESQGTTSVRLNGKEVVGAPDWGSTQKRVGRLYLDAAKPVDLEVEYTLPGRGKNQVELVWTKAEARRLTQAVEAAKKADVVVAVVGITSQLEGEELPLDLPGFKGGDRTSLDLPKEEQDLVEALAGSGKPLVLVLTNGSALSINKESKLANAVLDAFYPGEEGGTAVAETLSGRNNPAGRLPVTFYTGVDQLPPFENYAMNGRTYRYFSAKPLYPFGYGLSYTSFSYRNLVLPKGAIKAGSPLTAGVTVTNTGRREGDEVAQLYLSFPNVSGAPLRALRGFKRVHLKPGETQKVRFELQERDLSMITAAGEPIVAEGVYSVSIGGGQPNTDAPTVAGTFQITGTKTLPE
jgi:beta-glucosidase